MFTGINVILEAMLAEYGEEFKNSMRIYGGGVSPYALALNELIDKQLESQLNILWVYLH